MPASSSAGSLSALLALAAGPPPLEVALSRILLRPHRELVTRAEIVPVEALEEADAEGFMTLVQEPDAIVTAKDEPVHFQTDENPPRRFQLTRVVEERRLVTYDTAPNRFVAHVLRRYRGQLKRALAEAPSDGKRLLGAIDHALAHPAMAEARRAAWMAPDHPVLLKDPDYRVLLTFAMRLVDLVG